VFSQSEESTENEQLYIESLAGWLEDSHLHKDLDESLRPIVTEY